MFTNSGANDLSIATNSPCRDAGIDVGLTEDILGNLIVGAPDTGAYEYQAEYKSFTIDAALQDASLTKTFAVDARLLDRSTQIFNIDARLVSRSTKPFSIDTTLQAEQTKTFSVDSSLVATPIKAFSLDAVLQAEQTKTFALDALLVSRLTKEFTVDAQLIGQVTKTFTVDAAIQNVSVTKTFTVDAAVWYAIDSPIWPLPRPLAYDPDKVWSETEGAWYSPTSAIGAAILRTDTGRYQHYFIVINDDGDLFYGVV